MPIASLPMMMKQFELAEKKATCWLPAHRNSNLKKKAQTLIGKKSYFDTKILKRVDFNPAPSEVGREQELKKNTEQV